jgi:hypothetical protein
MLSETWEDQYRRLQRQHGLLKRTADSSIEYDELLHDQAHARDILYHFCCDAFHLRDWISTSTSLAQNIRTDVRNLFGVRNNAPGASTALAACADIANASKHLVLTSPPYTHGKHAEIVGQTQGATLPAKLPFHFGANHFKIDVGGVQRDALDVATDAIADWDAWLTGHGVSLPT